jgi:hypothetical protein
MIEYNNELNTEKINELIIELHGFMADFSQSELTSNFSFFLSCLRSSLIKNYEFCQFSYSNKECSEAYFFSLSILRGISEDLIVLGFISKLDHDNREVLIKYLQKIDINERLSRQKDFFEKYRPFQEILIPTQEDSFLENHKEHVQSIWRSNGWSNFNLVRVDSPPLCGEEGKLQSESLGSGAGLLPYPVRLRRGSLILKKNRPLPPVKELAEKLPSAGDALALLYDFIYRLTSSTVHFSPQTLLRLGWGALDTNKFTFSAKHFSNYYAKFCQVYSILLLCLYFEIFEDYILAESQVKTTILELRKEILSYTRWPEMITFEEMNIQAPKQYKNNPLPYILTHYHIFEKFKEGFLPSSLE